MRVLHVSDWHLGRVIYKEPRTEDHDTVLNEIISIARSEKPDLIVHSGDLFDHARPSVPDISKAATVLQELAAVSPVVVVRGNHDSPLLFRLYTQLLGPDSGIYFIDEPRDPDKGGVLRFHGADDTVLRLGVLPFVHAGRAIDAFGDVGHWRTAYAERIGRMEHALAAEMLRDFDDRRDVAVFAAHLHVGGANFARSERPVHVSDYYATNADDLPAVSYAAFGHIHKPQKLPGTRVTGRYAGSPIQLDFGEAGESKSVVLADLRPGQPAHIDLIGLSGGRQLHRLEGTLDELRAKAPSVGRDLCLVTVHTPTRQPSLSEQVRDLFPDAVLLDVQENPADQKLEVLTQDTVAEDAEPDTLQMFRDYLAEHGSSAAPADRLLKTFGQILTSLEEERPVVFDEESLLIDPPEPDDGTPTTEEP
ncbi:exonuclease SbcCD subunit D [Saccharopolyspora shandongensis]|uniref:exonuclease SbcCD subunit D n=1 Tax=Saccharopolyspora shandongensis TaxID=418495 RepID=UPI00340A2A5F